MSSGRQKVGPWSSRPDRVRITKGILAGFEGWLVEIIEPPNPETAPRIVVEVELAGRKTRVEYDYWDVESVREP